MRSGDCEGGGGGMSDEQLQIAVGEDVFTNRSVAPRALQL